MRAKRQKEMSKTLFLSPGLVIGVWKPSLRYCSPPRSVKPLCHWSYTARIPIGGGERLSLPSAQKVFQSCEFFHWWCFVLIGGISCIRSTVNAISKKGSNSAATNQLYLCISWYLNIFEYFTFQLKNNAKVKKLLSVVTWWVLLLN